MITKEKKQEIIEQYKVHEGIKEHAKQVARMMLNHQKPMDEVIMFSGLTKEEIEQLKEE